MLDPPIQKTYPSYLLFLILLSYMVASNRDLENIGFISSAFITSTTYIHSLPFAMKIDINSVNNYNDVRERSHSFSNVSSRSVSLVSRASSRPYYEKMIINNDLPDKEIVKPIDRSQLSYSGNYQERSCISMMTDPISLQEPQQVSNKALALNTYNVPCVGNDDIINI